MLGFKNISYSASNSYTADRAPDLQSPLAVLINIAEIPDIQAIQATNYDTSFSFMICNLVLRGSNIFYENMNEDNTIHAASTVT